MRTGENDMPMTPTPSVVAICRYPVKGLSPEPMQQVAVVAGETLPYDRAYAIENGAGRFNPNAPQYLPKISFLMLMRNERLASVRSQFDEATQTLTILRSDKPVVRGQLSTKLGRQMIEQFMAAYMGADLRGAPRIVSAPGHSFSDVSAKCLHIVSLASVRELQRVVGRPVNPLRFRANLYVDGVPPWAELDWLNSDLAIGSTKLVVFKRTQRCEATNVDPETGKRDMAIAATLLRTWGHSNFGVYARVTVGGPIIVGDSVASLQR
jgi:uncharacterized protein